MILNSLRDMKPFALAVDARTGNECALFEPFWSYDERFPVRCIKDKRMGAGRIVARKHLVNIVPCNGKKQIARKYNL